MKEYLWVIILGICGLLLLFLFVMTIATSSQLITKLRYSKSNLLLNFSLLIGGIVDIGLLIYLVMDVKSQIELMNNL
ncbi:MULTISPECIES: hypothetical protein [Vagococcus]|uniref:hypothetical protein n=1 Tax=Vagococcus TaxID=2737 RepID=UPI000E4763FF|nr:MULTISPECIES: hypothetical protein [Vagococcus]RHH66706.1 hypothetical protein DW196_10450 [Vagococcus sp. AM17-17]